MLLINGIAMSVSQVTKAGFSLKGKQQVTMYISILIKNDHLIKNYVKDSVLQKNICSVLMYHSLLYIIKKREILFENTNYTSAAKQK